MFMWRIKYENAVCACHVTCACQSESNVKELLARSKASLAEWLSVRFWVRVQLQSLWKCCCLLIALFIFYSNSQIYFLIILLKKESQNFVLHTLKWQKIDFLPPQFDFGTITDWNVFAVISFSSTSLSVMYRMLDENKKVINASFFLKKEEFFGTLSFS